MKAIKVVYINNTGRTSGRNVRNWQKKIDEVDLTKNNGEALIGDFLINGSNLIEEGSIILKVESLGSYRNSIQYAFLGIVNNEGGIDWIENFNRIEWHKNKGEIIMKCHNLLS